MGAAKDEGPQVSPEELARIERASRQFVSYTNFIRWATNFRADEIRAHPKHKAVKLLSPIDFAEDHPRKNRLCGNRE